MNEGHPLFVVFFMVGAIIFSVGLILRLSLYWRSQWNLRALLKGVFSTLFSARVVELIGTIFWDAILQRRLFAQDRVRWLMKVLIMVGYPGIIIAGHLKVEVMPQFEKLPHLIRFLYAPFCDFYYFQTIVGPSLSLSAALFAVSFDLFGTMILTGEFIAIYRRFVAKKSPFKTSAGDIVAVNLLGGWFILRFLCEATSILAYSLPDSVARYWFLSFGLSKIMAPLHLPWISMNYPLWSVSGLFLGMLVASIPYNKKLWHIVTIPLVMFINLMPKEAFKPGNRKASLPLSLKELVALDSCVKCGSCVDACPVYAHTAQPETTMGGFFANLRSFVGKAYGFPGALFGPGNAGQKVPKTYSDHAYLCTLCGRCAVTCPAFINTKELRIAGRGFMVAKGEYPASLDRLAETLERVHNIIGEPNEDRSAWVEALNDVPGSLHQKEKAKVIYFVGCVASFFPMAKRIPQSFARILDHAGVDFTILGGEEWCCGFPLIGAGMKEKAEALMQHNWEKVKEKGAEEVVFACPSCYHTWAETGRNGIRIFHSTQFIKKLIEEKRIRFNEKTIKVTYHDPCDLGRASGIYEVPREILQAIPGVELVEMKKNREQSTCCGGGGNLEMVNAEVSAALALAKIEEIRSTGADTVITACQQCVRTILTTARRKKIPLAAMDIIEFVQKNLK
jgi:heterodisulfide reductase subunit D